jgi:predicted nucleic acid-binding protein
MPAGLQGGNPPKAFLLDADAFINLRKLQIGSNSLMEVLLQRAKQQQRAVYPTEYVAKHDLSDLQAEITSLQSRGFLKVERLPSSDSDYARLRKQVDKGEAEAIAWCLKRDRRDRPVFVTRDKRALDRARDNKVPSTDLMGLLVESVESRLLTKREAKEAADPWNDPGQQIGKPRDYKTFDAAFAKRRSRGPYYYP